MAKPFFNRLKNYYSKVGSVLRGESEAASIFPNNPDNGMSRERVYAEFLRLHLPSSCNVLFGGFLFNLEGDESKQIDVIVTSDTCPQYNFHNRDGYGKSFACITGTLAVSSLKATLNSNELIDALDNIASLPSKEPLGAHQKPFMLNLSNYDDWPFKIIFASDGVSLETLTQTLNSYYQKNSSIPQSHRPNLIHVAGKYNIVRVGNEGGRTRDGSLIPANTFWGQPDTTDVYGLIYAVNNIQIRCNAAKYLLFNYGGILDNIPI